MTTDLGLGAACGTTGARKVGDTEVKNDMFVRRQVAWRKPEVPIAKFAATMFLNTPSERAPRHDEEARAGFV